MSSPNEVGAAPIEEAFTVASDGAVETHTPLITERMVVPTCQCALTTPPAPMMIDAAPLR